MAPTRRAPSPSLPTDLPSHPAAKRARTRHHELSVPAHLSDPSSAAGKMVTPHMAEQPQPHHDGRSADSDPGVSFGWPLPASPSDPVHQAGCGVATSTSPRTQRSLMLLERETHDTRLKLGRKEMEGKGTAKCYPRQVENYRAWFEQDQSRIAASDPSRAALPAFPVTAAKVASFLHHESTREKLKRGSKSKTIEGSSLGKSHIAQVVNALENHRLNHEHEHPQDHETKISLRKDARIRAFESASKHNEPSRIERSQAIKAAGTTSDTYTNEELLRCSLWALTEFSGRQHVLVGLRDRAMLLLSAATAFRGESCRMLQWSDLFRTTAPLDQTTRVEVLAALADNAKHNQHGRVDEHGVIRHHQVELCAVGALALMFFGHFHVLDRPPPSFAPDFANKQYGEYGHREWYSNYVFYAGSTTKEMSYDNHHERITVMHKKNNIDITKKTHAGRHYAALTARAHGASTSGTKALGGWNESGSFNSVYDRAFPLDALLGAAMYNGRRPEEYTLPRGCLVPPRDLLSQIFPFVESAQAELQDRVRQLPLATDIALKQFLSVLTWFCTILLQDGAVLYSRYPQLSIFQFAPFNTPQFHAFASQSVQQVASAEEASCLAFQNLPRHLIASLQGIVTNLSLEQQAQRVENEALRFEVRQHVATQNMLLAELACQSKGQRAVGGSGRASRSVSLPVPVPPASNPTPVPGLAPTELMISGHSMSHAATTLLPDDVRVHVPAQQGNHVPQPLAPVPESSPKSAPLDVCSEVWTALTEHYGRSRLDAHEWEWRDSDWLPHYRYQPVHAITELWTEHTEGLGGHLSTRELTERWGAKWRRNEGSLKTEGGRRAKVITLIQELAAKPNWNVPLALRFIKEKYEGNAAYLNRVRAFCDYLQKNRGVGYGAVLEAATNYP